MENSEPGGVTVCGKCGAGLLPDQKFCPSCGAPAEQEQSAPTACAKCGAELTPGQVFCSRCGQRTDQAASETAGTYSYSAGAVNAIKPKSGMNKKTLAIGAVALAAAILIAVFAFSGGTTLKGDDKIAFDLVVNAAYNFKDPSSVRLVSGCLGVDKDCMFAGISAVNGFGARTTEYYFITSDGYILEEESPPDSLYLITDEIDVKKINKALEKELKDRY